MFDFTQGKTTDVAAWQIVNDDVMGGISKSRMEVTNGMAVFSGDVSLENSGGFASVRSLPAGHELSGCKKFVLRARGDGRTYKFTARTSRSFDSAIYQVSFKTKKGEWEEHQFAISEFVPTFRARALRDEAPLDPGKVTSVGFLISDKQEGPFRLEISWVKATK